MRDSSQPGARHSPPLEECLAALAGGAAVERRVDGLWVTIPAPAVDAMAELMRSRAARLSAMTGLPLPDGETEVLYHFCLDALPINVRARTHAGAIPSIAPAIVAADWAEREITDLYAVRFDGHPRAERLLRPPSVSPGFFRAGASGMSRRGDPKPPPQPSEA